MLKRIQRLLASGRPAAGEWRKGYRDCWPVDALLRASGEKDTEIVGQWTPCCGRVEKRIQRLLASGRPAAGEWRKGYRDCWPVDALLRASGEKDTEIVGQWTPCCGRVDKRIQRLLASGRPAAGEWRKGYRDCWPVDALLRASGEKDTEIVGQWTPCCGRVEKRIQRLLASGRPAAGEWRKGYRDCWPVDALLRASGEKDTEIVGQWTPCCGRVEKRIQRLLASGRPAAGEWRKGRIILFGKMSPPRLRLFRMLQIYYQETAASKEISVQRRIMNYSRSSI